MKEYSSITTQNLMQDLNRYISDTGMCMRNTIEEKGISLIESVINLMDAMDENFDEETSSDLQKRFLNSIKNRDPSKFKRKLRQIGE